jgi:hypothetical protein
MDPEVVRFAYLGLPHPASSLLEVSHLLKGLHPAHRCSLVSCCYRSWGFHLQSVSHVDSRNRLRSVTLMALQDNMNIVMRCGPLAWTVPIQHLTVPLSPRVPKEHALTSSVVGPNTSLVVVALDCSATSCCLSCVPF